MVTGKRIALSQWIIILLVGFFCTGLYCAPGGVVHAGDADALAQQADKQLRDAEGKMFSGKNDEALQGLGEAAATIEALKAADPGHRKLKTLEGKYSKTKSAVEKKLGKTSTPSATAVTPTGEKPASPAKADKLPGGVSKRLRDIDRELSDADRMLANGRVDNARGKLAGAAELFAEIEKMYDGQFSPDNPDYAAARTRYAAVETQIGGVAAQQEAEKAQEAQAVQAQKAQSAEWVAKFTPYVANPAATGHDPEKYLVYPGTSQPEQMKKMNTVYEELKALYDQYSQADFPDGKTWELEKAEEDVRMALENFSSSYSGGIQSSEDDANRNIDQAMAQLQKDAGWKTDPKGLPPIIDSKWLQRITELVAQVERMYAPGEPALVALQEKQRKMVSIDQEHREIRAQRTFVRPEIYKGKDLKDIRSQAEAVVAKERPGAKVLRVSVYSDDWKEEQVLEHTDTTRTAVRYRITRMINAQVAVKDRAQCSLLTLHIAKDKQGEGWGKLYGNVMYADPMAEENVQK